MKPLSGMLLYINLGFAIIWDAIGFLLFIIGLIPGIQAVAVVFSIAVDVMAFLTDLILCFLYQGYVKAYNINIRVYQMKQIREMLRFSKNSGIANNRLSQNLARQTQKINQYLLDKFSNYVISFTVRKIQYSIITSVVELTPWLGDLSPSWTIKANLHLRDHKKTARELKLKVEEFENSLAKWRGSIRIGGIRKFKSSNNNGIYTRQSVNNRNRQFNGERLAGDRAQYVIQQQGIDQGIRDSAANNIRPFRRRVPGEIGQSTQVPKENKLANVKSAVNNIASASKNLMTSIPQSLEYEDEESRYRKASNNKIKPVNKELTNSGNQYMSSQNNTAEQFNGERLAGDRAQYVIQQQGIDQGIRDSAANNIRPFRRRVPGEIGQSTQVPKENKLANVKSAVNNIASASKNLMTSIPQSLEYEDEESRYRKASNNKIKPIKTPVLSDISKPISAQKENNLDDNNDSNNQRLVSNNIRQFTRNQQNQVDVEKTLETIVKK